MIDKFPPVLLYHKVSPRGEIGVTWVKPGAFKRQMETIAEAGWSTILPGEDADSKQFLLIFDDGYECIYKYAYPILSKLDFKAVVFIPTGYIGSTNDWDYQLFGRRFAHLSEAMLLELSKAGWMIGSHTVSHTDLLQLSNSQLEDEIAGSRSKLQDLTGQGIEWIAFPFGRYNQRVMDVAVNAGYTGAVVPVYRSDIVVPEGFSLIIADAVYLWSSIGLIERILRRDNGYRIHRKFQKLVNGSSYGTIIWKRLFSSNK